MIYFFICQRLWKTAKCRGKIRGFFRWMVSGNPVMLQKKIISILQPDKNTSYISGLTRLIATSSEAMDSYYCITVIDLKLCHFGL